MFSDLFMFMVGSVSDHIKYNMLDILYYEYSQLDIFLIRININCLSFCRNVEIPETIKATMLR